MENILDCFILIKKDLTGKIIRTEVYQKESSQYSAFSFYVREKNEEIIGRGDNLNKSEAISLSRKDLMDLWENKYM